MNILIRNRADNLFCKWFQSPDDGFINIFGGFAFLDAFVDFIFNENFLQRNVMKLIKQLLFPDFKFKLEKIDCALRIDLQYL